MTEMTDTLLTSIAAVLLIVLEIFRIRREKKINIDVSAPPPMDVCQRCPLMWAFRIEVENASKKRIRQTRN